jgi:hypothetical protein
VGLAEQTTGVYFGLAWLVVTTCVTLLILGRPHGMGRGGGALLVTLYTIFVTAQFAYG